MKKKSSTIKKTDLCCDRLHTTPPTCARPHGSPACWWSWCPCPSHPALSWQHERQRPYGWKRRRPCQHPVPRQTAGPECPSQTLQAGQQQLRAGWRPSCCPACHRSQCHKSSNCCLRLQGSTEKIFQLLEAERKEDGQIVRALTDFFNLEGNQTVININVASNLHNLSDVFVVQPQNFLITVVCVLVIERDLDGFTLFQLNLSSATLKTMRSDLRRELLTLASLELR